MHTHMTKIMPKSWFHKRPCRCIKWLPSTTIKHIVNNRGNTRSISCCMCSYPVHLLTHQGVFCPAFVIRQRGVWVSHTHYPLSYLICLLLIDIPRLVDREFRLEDRWLCRVNGYLAKIVAEAWFSERLCCWIDLGILRMQQ